MAATLGAGQTIYIVDAYHDATALSDLNAFSTKFGLPTCSNVAIATNATLPLADAAGQLHVLGGLLDDHGHDDSTAPAYNATWAPESKLDVQWAHAIAPLARIVLIEMPSSMSTAILGANTLAGKLGRGVVSMSFGSAEAGWVVDRRPLLHRRRHDLRRGRRRLRLAGAVAGRLAQRRGRRRHQPELVRLAAPATKRPGCNTGGGMSAYEALPAWQSGVTRGRRRRARAPRRARRRLQRQPDTPASTSR